VDGLAIKEVAEQTGVAAGTIRMWEQRYGFPEPARTPSGYRRYCEADVGAIRRVVAYRRRGLSVPAAIERARGAGPIDRPSIYAAVATVDAELGSRSLRKSTLFAMSRAMEDEALARAAAPIVFAAFQHEGFYRSVEYRYRRLAEASDATVVFADFPRLREEPGRPVEVPIAPDDALGNEWALIVDAPGYAACLLAWEQPGTITPGGPDDDDRRFESMWTLDPAVTRKAARVAARLVTRQDAALGARLDAQLADRPMAMEEPTPALTAVTNRIVEYLEAA
jgi:MerR family transcriptional regulator, light-induced transcriptional regulator